jgi:hypothetical protein
MSDLTAARACLAEDMAIPDEIYASAGTQLERAAGGLEFPAAARALLVGNAGTRQELSLSGRPGHDDGPSGVVLVSREQLDQRDTAQP